MRYSGFSPSGFLVRQRREDHPLSAYLSAVSLPIVALAATLVFWSTTYPAVFLLFFGAVSVVASQAGFWPGLVSTIESAIFAEYFLMIPRHTWSRDPQTIARICIFIMCGALISWLGERQRRSSGLLRRMNSRLAHEHERLKLALSAADAFAWEWTATPEPTAPKRESEILRELKRIVFQKNWPGDVHKEDEETFNKVILEEIKQPASFELEYRIGAEKRWLRTKGQAVTGSPGISNSLVGITFDITKERQSVEALRRSEKLATMGQLSATIAHEINNPLESITSLMYLAKATSGVPPQVLEYLDLGLAEAERVAEIARSTLGFCRESRKAEIVRVGDALKVILRLYQKKALKRQGGCLLGERKA